MSVFVDDSVREPLDDESSVGPTNQPEPSKIAPKPSKRRSKRSSRRASLSMPSTSAVAPDALGTPAELPKSPRSRSASLKNKDKGNQSPRRRANNELQKVEAGLQQDVPPLSLQGTRRPSRGGSAKSPRALGSPRSPRSPRRSPRSKSTKSSPRGKKKTLVRSPRSDRSHGKRRKQRRKSTVQRVYHEFEVQFDETELGSDGDDGDDDDDDDLNEQLSWVKNGIPEDVWSPMAVRAAFVVEHDMRALRRLFLPATSQPSPATAEMAKAAAFVVANEDNPRASVAVVDDTDSADELVFDQNGDVVLRCPLGDCLWQGPLKQIETHVRTQCDYMPTVCPYDGCEKRLIRLVAKFHYGVCPHRSTDAAVVARLERLQREVAESKAELGDLIQQVTVAQERLRKEKKSSRKQKQLREQVVDLQTDVERLTEHIALVEMAMAKPQLPNNADIELVVEIDDSSDGEEAAGDPSSVSATGTLVGSNGHPSTASGTKVQGTGEESLNAPSGSSKPPGKQKSRQKSISSVEPTKTTSTTAPLATAAATKTTSPRSPVPKKVGAENTNDDDSSDELPSVPYAAAAAAAATTTTAAAADDESGKVKALAAGLAGAIPTRGGRGRGAGGPPQGSPVMMGRGGSGRGFRGGRGGSPGGSPVLGRGGGRGRGRGGGRGGAAGAGTGGKTDGSDSLRSSSGSLDVSIQKERPRGDSKRRPPSTYNTLRLSFTDGAEKKTAETATIKNDEADDAADSSSSSSSSSGSLPELAMSSEASARQRKAKATAATAAATAADSTVDKEQHDPSAPSPPDTDTEEEREITQPSLASPRPPPPESSEEESSDQDAPDAISAAAAAAAAAAVAKQAELEAQKKQRQEEAKQRAQEEEKQKRRAEEMEKERKHAADKKAAEEKRKAQEQADLKNVKDAENAAAAGVAEKQKKEKQKDNEEVVSPGRRPTSPPVLVSPPQSSGSFPDNSFASDERPDADVLRCVQHHVSKDYDQVKECLENLDKAGKKQFKRIIGEWKEVKAAGKLYVLPGLVIPASRSHVASSRGSSRSPETDKLKSSQSSPVLHAKPPSTLKTSASGTSLVVTAGNLDRSSASYIKRVKQLPFGVDNIPDPPTASVCLELHKAKLYDLAKQKIALLDKPEKKKFKELLKKYKESKEQQ